MTEITELFGDIRTDTKALYDRLEDMKKAVADKNFAKIGFLLEFAQKDVRRIHEKSFTLEDKLKEVVE